MLDPQVIDDENPSTVPLLQPHEKEDPNASFRSTPEEKSKCEAAGRQVFICTALAFAGFAIFITNRAVTDNGDGRDNATYYSAAAFVIISSLMTMREVILHLFHWNNPVLQTRYISIILLVPWMGIFSFCSLRFYDGEVYFEAAIDGYEAFVVYSYGSMLIELLGGEEAAIELLKTKEPLNHRCCCAPFCDKWPMDETFIARVKWALKWLIYVKLGHAVLIIITEPLKQYDNMQIAWNLFTLSTIFVVYFTVNGMYSTIMFYTAVKDDLTEPKDWQPTPKLFSFKAILLLSHVTGLIIAILVSSGAIKSAQGWDEDHVAAFLQNWCYCLLMVFISILNSFAYSYTDFLEPDEGNEEKEDIFDFDDDDVRKADIVEPDVENEAKEENEGKFDLGTADHEPFL